MKTWRSRVLGCVVVGVAANVGLAWVCAIWSPRSSLSEPYWPDNQDRRWWRNAAPTFGAAPTRVAISHGFGVSYDFMWYEAPGNPTIGNNGFHLRTGWPFRSMEGGKVVDRVNRKVDRWFLGHTPAVFLGHTPAVWPFQAHQLPLKPIWIGTVLNSILFACIAFFGIVLTLHLRRLFRLRRGSCPECGYPIASSSACCECSRSVQRSPAA